MEYSFWMVWFRTCEGNKRWHMVRTPNDWDVDMVMERAKQDLGGIGDDPAEILEIEYGYDDDIYTDYTND